jgi:hypothetical protein
MKRETRQGEIFRLLTVSFFYFLSLPLVKELVFSDGGCFPSGTQLQQRVFVWTLAAGLDVLPLGDTGRSSSLLSGVPLNRD